MAGRKNIRSLDNALEDFKRVKDKEMAEWARLFLEARGGEDKIPKGWYSERQLAEKFGMSITGVRPHIRKLENEGKLEVKKFKIKVEKRMYRINHYRIKK